MLTSFHDIFSCLSLSPYSSLCSCFFVRNLCVIFFTIFHVRGFSSSCIVVSSCLVHTVSVISDDLNIVSVQCIVGFLFNFFSCSAKKL